MIIAAVGKNASGKDYFLKYLSDKYAIPMISIGDIARELATKEGLEHSRENPALHLQQIHEPVRPKLLSGAGCQKGARVRHQKRTDFWAYGR